MTKRVRQSQQTVSNNSFRKKGSKESRNRVAGVVRVEFDVRLSAIDGKGLFAKSTIRARRKIGDLGGEIIAQSAVHRRVNGQQRIAVVELRNGKAVDASRCGNALKYINHSCSPNTYIRIVHERVEFYALSDIHAGEELTCDYGATHHKGKRQCQCGSKECRGFI